MSSSAIFFRCNENNLTVSVRLFFAYVVFVKTNICKVFLTRNRIAFFVEKHLYVVNNTCNFMGRIVNCICYV